MRTTKRLIRTVEVAAGVIGMVAVSAPESPVGRRARQLSRRLARDVRYSVASAPGVLYRLGGRKPDPSVSDDILADRIRSAIGPREKRLDMPRVHIMVEDHVAILHGEVPSGHDAHTIENAVMRVSGVTGIESHLHVGLAPGDTVPSQGRAHEPPSEAMLRLTDAASHAGAHNPKAAVHAVLCGFADRLPENERAHVFAHLSADVQALAGPPRRRGERPPRLKTVPQLVAATTAQGGVEPDRAEAITRAVLAALRGLAPEEAADIAAVLPPELRELWEGAAVR